MIILVLIIYFIADNTVFQGLLVLKMLITDTYIVNAISAGHSFDIPICDFKKAFDRAPHKTALACLLNLEFVGYSLCWFASFLSEWTQTVKLGNSCSQISSEPSLPSGPLQ